MKLLILSIMTFTLSLSATAANDLSDGQIAIVVMTVDKGEIDLGKLAQKISNNPEVLNFANNMISDHSMELEEISNLVRKLILTSETSERSIQIKKDGDLTKANLMSKKEPKTFDKAYIDAMVASHKEVIKEIDEELMPSVSNTDLIDMLKIKRQMDERHLKQAQELQAKL